MGGTWEQLGEHIPCAALCCAPSEKKMRHLPLPEKKGCEVFLQNCCSYEERKKKKQEDKTESDLSLLP